MYHKSAFFDAHINFDTKKFVVILTLFANENVNAHKCEHFQAYCKRKTYFYISIDSY
jgi:hypothetical protein